MAFVKVEKIHVGGGVPSSAEPQIRMGAYLADGKVHKSKSVNFRFNFALIERMKWPFDDKRGTQLVVHEGTDADKGFLQIVPTIPSDPAARRMTIGEGKQGAAISLVIESFKHYVLNECPAAASTVAHVIDDGALIIECPDWLRYNPASAPEPEPMVDVEVHLPKKLQDMQPNREQRRHIAKTVERSLRR